MALPARKRTPVRAEAISESPPVLRKWPPALAGVENTLNQEDGMRHSDASMVSKRMRGMGSVFERRYKRRDGSVGVRWWIQYSHRGKVYREPSGSGQRSKAVKLLQRRMGEMGQGKFIGRGAEQLSFDELAGMLEDDYRVNGRKSLERAKRSIAHLRGFFGNDRALEITPDRVTSYIRWRLDKSGRLVRPATIRLELAALGRMFTLAEHAGKIPHRPRFPSIEVRNTRTGFFEDTEFAAV